MLNTAEIYNPATGTFTAVGHLMTTARAYAAAAPLPNGEVLIVGGEMEGSLQRLNTAEIYNPITRTFSALEHQMTAGRAGPAAAPLPNGEVLIAGGDNLGTLNTAEIYNPITGTFSALEHQMTAGRTDPAADPLPSGEVLIAGGGQGNLAQISTSLDTAELYNPATGTFREVSATMIESRRASAVAPLPNGEILLVGGEGGSTAPESAELFLSAPSAAYSEGLFGAAPLGHAAPAQTITVTNRGAQTLAIFGIALAGADPEEFTVRRNSCSGARLAFNESCSIAVSFTPKATGTQTAFLKLEDNEEEPAEIPLSGEGFPLVPGPQGPTGPQGTQGLSGREGPPGKVEILACKTKVRVVKRHGRRRRVTVKRCSLRPLPKNFKVDGRKIVRLASRGRTFALGRASAGHITLRLLKPLRPGRYTLLVGFGRKSRRASVVVVLERRQGA